MNFTRIEYFLAAAKYLNITKAAKVLYISQPSLSKQIALLEEELGVQLFNRSKNALLLTPAGELIYSEFSKIIPEAEAVLERAKRMKSASNGTLSIGFVESMSIGDTAKKMIRNFSAQEQNVALYIERYSFEALRNKMMDGAIDVAFTISQEIKNMRDIMRAEIEQRQTHIIISANHKLADRETLGLEDLRNETFVLMNKETSHISYDHIFRACRELGFFPKIRYAPNNETILDYLELGAYVSFFDKSIVENRKEKLKFYPSPVGGHFALLCIWKKNNPNPALNEFIKYLPSKPTCLEKS